MTKVLPIKKWYATHTRAKCESIVTRELSQFCETYLPMQKVRRKWSDRIKKLTIPLVPSYTFIKIFEKDKRNVTNNRNVINIINNHGRLIPIPEGEMNLIKRIEQAKIQFDFLQDGYEYQLGEKIEFSSGPLFGQEGYIDSFLNNSCAIIQVPSLGWWFKTKLKYISPHYSEINLEPTL